jgi:hypothetical protein
LVPEPDSIALLGIGMASAFAFRRLIKRRTRLIATGVIRRPSGPGSGPKRGYP